MDSLFPIPEPEFLWVHTANLLRTSNAPPEANDEGWEVDNVALGPPTPLLGYVSTPDERVESGVELVNAVFLTSNTNVVSFADHLDVPAQDGLSPVLVGRYRVEAVRPNASHTRVLLARVRWPEGAQVNDANG